MMIPNSLVEDKCIIIFSNMLKWSVKGILYTNQVRAADHFYDYKPHKIGSKQRLVTVDTRKIHMFISDELDYLPVWFPTDEDMESFIKVFITPPGEWKPLYLDHDGQWEDYDDEVSICSNVSDNSSDQAIDVLEPIMSASQHEYPTVTFPNDVAFTKGATYD